MLARHGHQQERIGPVDPLEADGDTVPTGLVAWRLMRAAGDILIGADRLQNALTVLPNEYAGTEGPQFRLLLVDAHAPATIVQCDRRGQASEPRSGDFCMHQPTPMPTTSARYMLAQEDVASVAERCTAIAGGGAITLPNIAAGPGATMQPSAFS